MNISFSFCMLQYTKQYVFTQHTNIQSYILQCTQFTIVHNTYGSNLGHIKGIALEGICIIKGELRRFL